jgi:hypothetical protein
MRAWCVESVSDNGVVVVLYPDGERCTITIPRESIPKFRKLIETGLRSDWWQSGDDSGARQGDERINAGGAEQTEERGFHGQHLQQRGGEDD